MEPKASLTSSSDSAHTLGCAKARVFIESGPSGAGGSSSEVESLPERLRQALGGVPSGASIPTVKARTPTVSETHASEGDARWRWRPSKVILPWPSVVRDARLTTSKGFFGRGGRRALPTWKRAAQPSPFS